MIHFFLGLLLLFARYLHVVCTTLLVGGTLFYEMVVPVAIDELAPEQQLLVFARARWVFKSIVWSCAVLLIGSGIVVTAAHWTSYSSDQYVVTTMRPTGGTSEVIINGGQAIPPAGRPGWWWAAHASTGFLAVLIALSLSTGSVPPARPIAWMRLNLVILLLVIFLASVTRHVRLSAEARLPKWAVPDTVNPY